MLEPAREPALIAYPETWLAADQLGTTFPVYQPTYPHQRPFLTGLHEWIGTAPSPKRALGIPGRLRRADALKLYELAFFADGPVLELGCHHGLSTCILAQALVDGAAAKTPHPLTSIDLSPLAVWRTQKQLRRRALHAHTRVRWGEAARTCRRLADTPPPFAFIFVDHHHGYGSVRALCDLLPDLLRPGGFCLFHDYNDARNHSRAWDFGVTQAVTDGLADKPFAFFGLFGCTALFRRTA